MARRTGKQIDREAVIEAGFAILAEHGLAELSMRRLAQRLNVQAPALYWHFTGKPELLGLMAAEIYAQARSTVPPCEDWRAWLYAYGESLHDHLREGRDFAQLCATAQPIMEGPPASAEAIAAPLSALGLDPATALSGVASVTSLALGWAMFETNGPMHSFLSDLIDIDRSFHAGLSALTNGLEAAGSRQ